MVCEYFSKKQQRAEASENRRLVSKLAASGWLTVANLDSAIKRYNGNSLLVDLGGDGLRAYNLLLANLQINVVSMSLKPSDGFCVTRIPECPDPERHRFVWGNAIAALRVLPSGSLHANLEMNNVCENGNIDDIKVLSIENPEIIDFSIASQGAIVKAYLIAKYALKALTPGMHLSLEILEASGALEILCKILSVFKDELGIKIETLEMSAEEAHQRTNYVSNLLYNGKISCPYLRITKL
jgi:hypothetical protein